MTIATVVEEALARDRRAVGRRVPQVQRLQHGVPGRAGRRPVPGPQVRGSAGPALPARRPGADQPRRHAGAHAGSHRRLVLRLRLVHDRLPGGREDRRDEQPGPRLDAGGPAAPAPRLAARPDRPAREVRRAVHAARQLDAAEPAVPGAPRGRRSASTARRPCRVYAGRHVPIALCAARRLPRARGRTGAAAARPGRRLLPRLRRELLRAARRGRRDRRPRPERVRGDRRRRRCAAACR